MNELRFVSMVFIAFCFTTTANSDESTGSDNSPANDQEQSDPVVVNQLALPNLKSSEAVEAMGDLVQTISDLAFETLDDVLSEDSVNKALEEAWATQVEEFDSDGSGGLSREEVAEIPDFRLDDDGNVLSDEEFAELMEETFEDLDMDSDGQITKKETQKYIMSEIGKTQEAIDSAKGEFNLKLVPVEESSEPSPDVDTGEIQQ